MLWMIPLRWTDVHFLWHQTEPRREKLCWNQAFKAWAFDFRDQLSEYSTFLQQAKGMQLVGLG